MPGDQDGFLVRRIIEGAPLLLAFDGADDAEAWEKIARHRDPPAGLILLRDPAAAGYYRGIPGLGDSIGGAAEALSAMIAGSGAAGVVAAGAGLGGHAALVFGTLLGAARIVAVEPVAHLIAEELASYNDRRWARVLAAIPRPSPARLFDVPTLMGRRGFTGVALVLFGTGRAGGDVQSVHPSQVHAEWLARSDRVTLHAVPEVLPDRWRELLLRDEVEAMVVRHLFDAEAPTSDRAAPAFRRPESGHCFVSVIRQPLDNGTEVVYAMAGDGTAPELRPVNDEIRRWIAENLLVGESPASIAGAMQRVGFSEVVARAEIELASGSPYLWGAVRLQNRLRKRDWLLSVYRKLRRLRDDLGDVDRRFRLSRDALLREHYAANRPAIIAGMMTGRSVRGPWTLAGLEQRFGDRDVVLRRAWTERDRHAREEMTRFARLSEFIGMLRVEANDYCLTTEDPANRESLSGLRDELEPIPEYLDGDGRPDGWIRLDPPGSFREFRHERGNMLLISMIGTIRVKLVPSWDLPLMRNTVGELSEADGRRPDLALPPGPGSPQVFEASIRAGEILFLPAGWWSFLECDEPSAMASASAFVFDNDFPGPESI